jgi:drug/metabolite transporter (DMT)-like permease
MFSLVGPAWSGSSRLLETYLEIHITRFHLPAAHWRFLKSDRFLFWGPTLIWATTWHVILYQLGDVPVLQSVSMRFGLASVLLFAIAIVRRSLRRMSLRQHGWLMLTGTIQYGLNYTSTYYAEKHLPSGLVAVLFSLMIFTNALGGAWFFGQVVTRRFWCSGLFGVAGIVLIFWPDIVAGQNNGDVWIGTGLAMGSITLASTGNLLTLRLVKEGMSMVPLLAWTMGYGALTLLAIAVAGGVEFRLDPRWSYWASLAYLSAMGSVTAFLLYFKLAERQGAGRASLMGLLIPVIALAMSAAFEGWRLSVVSAVGIAVCLAGLWGAVRSAWKA